MYALLNYHSLYEYYLLRFALVYSPILLFLCFRAFSIHSKITIPYIHRCLFVG